MTLGRLVRSAAVLAVPLLVGAIGLVETLHVLLRSGFRLVHTDPGDARHLNYILEHSFRWLVGDPAHRNLWTLPFFFPVPNTGGFSEMLLGVAPFYIPWRLLGLEPDTSLQAWTITVLLLTFASGVALFRRGFGFGLVPSSLASFLFAFGAPRVLKLGHQHLLAHFFTATALLALLEIFHPSAPSAPNRRPGPAWVVLFFASVVAQLYAGFYLGWFFCLALGVSGGLVLAMPVYRRPFLAVVRARFVALSCGTVAAGLVLWPLAQHHLAAARLVGMRSFEDVRPLLPPLKAWLNPGPCSWLYSGIGTLPRFSGLPLEWEKRLFIGFVTTCASVCGLFLTRRRPAVRLILLTTAVVVGLATAWPGDLTAWRLVYTVVPGAKAMRAVSRVGLLVLIPAAIGLAAAVEQLSKRKRFLVVAGLFPIVMLEQGQTLPSYDKLEIRRDVDTVVAAIPSTCSSFFYSPIGRTKPVWESQLDAMWAGMATGIPTVNGYSSNLPPAWGPLFDHAVATRGEPRIRDALLAWCNENGLDPSSVCLVQVPPRAR